MASEPRVCVIVPCFNEGELVAEAVRSISEPEPVETVVVDDASTDERTREVLADLEGEGTRILRHAANMGLIAARMSGLAATRAPYVFPLDGDDLAFPGALSAMADRLESDEADVCYGDYLEFGTQETLRAVPERLDPYRLTYTNEYPVSALFRRPTLESAGGWAAAGCAESAYADWNLWIALAERDVRAVHLGVGVPTFRKRFHEGRMRVAALRRHRYLYRDIRERHPELSAHLARHRRASDLSPARKLLYPLVYGGRPRLRFEPKLKPLLDRLGIWTLRR